MVTAGPLSLINPLLSLTRLGRDYYVIIAYYQEKCKVKLLIMNLSTILFEYKNLSNFFLIFSINSIHFIDLF